MTLKPPEPTVQRPAAAAVDLPLGPTLPVTPASASGSANGNGSGGGNGAPAGPSLTGTVLDERYVVMERVGEGGMGVVYEARHNVLGKRIAVKVLRDQVAERSEAAARFQQEARLASATGHEHIVDITDFGRTPDGRLYLAMEFLEGPSLAELLAREGTLDEGRLVAIVRQVVSALGAAHQKGIIHRDMKPENILLIDREIGGRREFVKLVDFGISKVREAGAEDSDVKLTSTGMVLGTPLYMSPEQARGETDLDHRIDIYAVGVIMYELLTGRVPFPGQNYLGVISKHLTEEPVPPRKARPDRPITVAAERVTLKAMAKDRNARYQTMGELGDDLRRLAEGKKVEARLTGAQLSRSRRTRLLLAGTALFGALMVIVGARLLDARSARGVAAPAVLAIASNAGPAALAGAADATAAAPAAAASAAGADAAPAAPSASPADAAAGAAAAAAADAAVEPATVTLTLVSEPPGATVLRGGQEIGTTPLPVEVPRSLEPIEFQLSRKGFMSVRSQAIADRDKTLRFPLVPQPKADAAGSRRRGGKRGGPGRDDGPASEILPNPYVR
jgi:serine/threonine-protein kinase